MQPSLEETAHITCPRCSGTGHIRGTESTALHVLRIIQEEAMKENTGAVHAQVPVDVASFLLNEKRNEIQKLEARLKVNIVLVPNQHLETPHYKVQRLKHDELNEMEHVPASYELVEQPEEPKLGAEAEPVKERQEAVVKAITPAQPAPLVAEPQPRAPGETRAQRPQRRPERMPSPMMAVPVRPGIIGRILGWFKLEQAAPGATVAAPALEPQTGQREPHREPRQRDRRPEQRGDHRRGAERGERGERAGRGERGGRDRRGERGDRSERRDGQQSRLEQRGNGQPREARPSGERRPDQRPPRPPHAEAEPRAARPEAQAGSTPESEEHRRSRRGRRDRGRERRPEQTESGIDQRPHGVAPEVPTPSPSHQTEPVTVTVSEPMHAISTPPLPEFPAPQIAEQVPVQRAAPAPEPVFERQAPEMQAPFEPLPPVMPAVEPKAEPTAELDRSGLVMIETNPSKARTVRPEPEQTQALGRARRERTSRRTEAEPELVQIETRK